MIRKNNQAIFPIEAHGENQDEAREKIVVSWAACPGCNPLQDRLCSENNVNECLVDKTTAISHEDYIAAKNGMLNVSLAGIRKVSEEWFPTLKGADVLALACGGGQQCPVFAAHGAEVMVTDTTIKGTNEIFSVNAF